MSTQIKLIITQGETKAELELDTASNLDKLMIMDHVFRLFGVSTDALEMADIYSKIGKRYKTFFDQMEPDEIKKEIEPESVINTDIKEQYITALTTEEPEPIQEEKLEFWRTGIKIRNGIETYICHYECAICKFKGNHYIPETVEKVRCRSCGTEMKVYPAHPNGIKNEQGELQRDKFGNIMRAGDYKDFTLWD